MNTEAKVGQGITLYASGEFVYTRSSILLSSLKVNNLLELENSLKTCVV